VYESLVSVCGVDENGEYEFSIILVCFFFKTVRQR
jgi:hypothetical protein